MGWTECKHLPPLLKPNSRARRCRLVNRDDLTLGQMELLGGSIQNPDSYMICEETDCTDPDNCPASQNRG
jgi:hypothetical protein